MNSDDMEPEKGNPFNIINFSDEILVKIIRHLDRIDDIVNLSRSCTRFDTLLEDRTFCKCVKIHWNHSLSRKDLSSFLKQPNRSLNITIFDITDFYWIPSSIIRNLAIKLVNLKSFYSAGTQLNWKHLSQLLKGLVHLQNLSWSLDSRLEDSILNETSQKESLRGISDLQDIFTRLKFLCIHIPILHKCERTIVASYSSLCYIISLCSSLEHLWIMSFPKTAIECKLSTNLSRERFFLEQPTFNRLKNCIIQVQEPSRIYTPKLYTFLLKSFQENKLHVENLWLDHPLFDIYFLTTGSPSKCIPVNDKYQFDFKNLESLSIPLTEKTLCFIKSKSFSKLKRLKIFSALSHVISLNGLFDSASNLEVFYSSAFNYRLDWNIFVKSHPNLREINICEDGSLSYPEYCIALSLNKNLVKMSLPISTLMEIRQPEILIEYRSKLDLENINSSDNNIHDNDNRNLPIAETITFKKRRIGIPVAKKEDCNPSSISGLDLITSGCPNVEEFELGFCKNTSNAITGGGLVLTNSLFAMRRWTSLKCLTLHNIPITSGKFLIEVARNCVQLEVLRISHLGPKIKCNYIGDLMSALKICPALKDFRLEQNYIGSPHLLLKTLGTECKNLTRLLIWSSPNDSPLTKESSSYLLENCSNLRLLYLIIGSTTLVRCKEIEQMLRNLSKNTPSLNIIIKNSLEETSSSSSINYSSIHYRQLVCSGSKIAQYIDFPSPTFY